MKEAARGSNHGIRAVVTADRNSQLRRKITSLLGCLGVEYSLCDDVYQAAGEILSFQRQYSLTAVLVIGSLEELSKDDMRFFKICRTDGSIECFCLAGNNSKQTPQEIVEIAGMDVCVVDGFDELERLLARAVEEAGGKDRIAESMNDIALSREDLEALMET